MPKKINEIIEAYMFMDFVTKEGTTYYLKAQTGNVALIGLKMYKRHSAFPTFCSQ